MKIYIDTQRNFFNTNATKEISFRLNELKRLEKVLKDNLSSLNKAIYADFKKSAVETHLTELGILFKDISEAKHHLGRWAQKHKVRTNIPNFPASSYIIPEPLGVCLIIGAWNYPYLLTLGPVVAAIAAGNTAIIKPSEIASETSKLLGKLINENFDPSFLKVIEGGVPETTELLAQEFDKIFFTGSTKVGKIVYQAAAKHMTPVTLELGGKSPAFVTANCNLKMTAKRLIWSKFLNAGQTCIAPDYVMIDAKIEAEFIAYAQKEIESAKYHFDNENYVQIISDHHFERLEKLLDSGDLVFGGKKDKTKRYIQPTLLKNVTFNDKVMQEEIFGPILPVISYTSIDAAIEQVRRLPKPLSCYVFTSSNTQKRKLLNELSFGGGAINDAVMHFSNPNLPFGGVGNSGIGSYHGEAGFKTFSHFKSILDKPTWFELPIKFSPYTKWKKKILKYL